MRKGAGLASPSPPKEEEKKMGRTGAAMGHWRSGRKKMAECNQMMDEQCLKEMKKMLEDCVKADNRKAKT